GRRGAAAGGHHLPRQVAQGVVLVVDVQAGRPRRRRPVLGGEQVVAVVVGVQPGLGAGPLALLRQVALGVVGVRPGAVGRQLVALVAALAEAGVGAVAGR